MPKGQSEEGAQFVRYFGPLIDALRGLGGSGTPDEVAERIAINQKISDEIRNELLPSGELRYRNQVHWARFYLVREGLIESSKRGVWSLSERGQTTSLSQQQSRDIFLKWVRFFQEERRAKAPKSVPTPDVVPSTIRGETVGYDRAVINLMLSLPPSGFERLSQRILRESGFVQVEVTGSSGDGGIDGHGTLQVNPLVSFRVLFQCKRYAGSVTPSQIRDFRGAMAGRADKGIVITTGTFTTEARREAS